MPIARYQLPDGRIARFEMPEGTTPEQAQAYGDVFFAQPQNSEGVSAEASRMAAEDMGPLDSLAVATGQGFDKLAMGLRELTLKGVRQFAPKNFSDAADRELKTQEGQELVNDSAYAGLREKRPVITGVGEGAPALMATGPMGLVPGALMFGGFEALKPGSTQERVQRGAIGAAASAVGGYVGKQIAGAIAPVAKKVGNVAKREALQVADKLGYKPRLSEITESPFLARLEDMAARTPGGAGIMQDFAQANQTAINRAAARSIGEEAEQLTSEVFARASDRIGGVFEKIRSLPGKPIVITPKVGQVADEVTRVTGKMIPSARDGELLKLAKQAKLLSSNMGKLDGEAYQLIRSNLSEASFNATGVNKTLYGKLLKALDDAAQDSLERAGKGDLAKAFKEARPQYGNLKVLEKGATSKGGNVSPSSVASTLRTNNPAAFREGRLSANPLNDVAILGERMNPLQVGSQTYERALAGDLLATIVRAPYAYGAAKLTTGSLPRAYAGLMASSPVANYLAQPIAKAADPSSRLLANYLAQRLLIPSVPVFAE